MDRKRFINLAIGVILAVVAVSLISIRSQEKDKVIRNLITRGELTEVVAATQDIPKNKVIRSNMVSLVRVVTKDLQQGALKSIDSVIGKLADVDILKDQYIYSNMVRFSRSAETLSQKTPSGKRAFTISIDRISAVGGLIKAGDRIDVVGMVNIPQVAGGKQSTQKVVLTLFENAKVLYVDEGSKSQRTVTLALIPEEIKILTYALELGQIKLVLRPPLDTSEEGSFKPFTFETFMQKIYKAINFDPTRVAPPAPKKEEPKVEIYRGGKE